MSIDQVGAGPAGDDASAAAAATAAPAEPISAEQAAAQAAVAAAKAKQVARNERDMLFAKRLEQLLRFHRRFLPGPDEPAPTREAFEAATKSGARAQQGGDNLRQTKLSFGPAAAGGEGGDGGDDGRDFLSFLLSDQTDAKKKPKPPRPAATGTSTFTPRTKALPYERDAEGRPILPIAVSSASTVLSLGRVAWDLPKFHSAKYIWPIGYKATRVYNSMHDIESRILYTCEILEDGRGNPVFRITPEDDVDHPVDGDTATAAWTAVVRAVNNKKSKENRRSFTAVSGPEWFAFAHPTIAKLIQELPDVDKCSKYEMKVESGEAHTVRRRKSGKKVLQK